MMTVAASFGSAADNQRMKSSRSDPDLSNAASIAIWTRSSKGRSGGLIGRSDLTQVAGSSSDRNAGARLWRVACSNA